MKKAAIIIIAAVLMISAACVVSADTDISRERIQELAALSGMDADWIYDVLNDADITAEQLDAMTEEEILEGLRKRTAQDKRIDYGYLFTDPSIRQTLGDQELLRVAVFSSDDAINPSLLVDYAEKKIYYSGGIKFFDDLNRADSVIALDEETARAVRDIVREILEMEYNDSDHTLQVIGGNLAGLAVETDLGVTSYIIDDVQADSGIELSSYISRIFRLYYDKTE